MKIRKIAWVVAAVVVIGVFFLFKAQGKGAKNQAAEFRSVQVERGPLEMTVLATGEVQPDNRLEIKPPIAGRIEEVLVEEGQPVPRGKILAWMSSTERAALLDAARAQGPTELAHWEQLYKPAPLVAPLDGVIIARNVEPGQTVTTSDAILVLSDRMIVKASVDETDIGQIKLDQPATIVLDAYPAESIAGKVSHIAYEAKTVNNVTTYEVDVLPQQVPDFMRSGMTANITFLVANRDNALLIPAEALVQKKGETSVMRAGPSGEKGSVSTPVQIGLNDGKKAEVLSGLTEADRVLVPVVRVPRSGAGTSSPFSPWGRQRSSSSGRGRPG